jgi:hypothetical protein
MARAVLSSPTPAIAAALIALSGAHEPARAGDVSCAPPAAAAPSLAAAFPALKQAAEKSAFFSWANKHFGAPTACEASIDHDSVVISYAFAKSAKLTTRSNPASELNVQRLELPDAAGVDAEPLLRAQEKSSAGQDGCGIDWSKPRRATGPSGPATTFVGDVCNCQARIEMNSGNVRALELKSAC